MTCSLKQQLLFCSSFVREGSDSEEILLSIVSARHFWLFGVDLEDFHQLQCTSVCETQSYLMLNKISSESLHERSKNEFVYYCESGSLCLQHCLDDGCL